jgi:hypothetical protein
LASSYAQNPKGAQEKSAARIPAPCSIMYPIDINSLLCFSGCKSQFQPTHQGPGRHSAQTSYPQRYPQGLINSAFTGQRVNGKYPYFLAGIKPL